MTTAKNISALFNPQSVAVIGASTHPGKLGYAVVANLKNNGFQGQIFPVNPSAAEILGLPVTPTIAALPDGIDLAVVVLPPVAVIDAMTELAAHKIHSAIVITAGFKEIGGEGAHLEQQLKDLCQAHDIAMVGPNCLGLISTPNHLNASFAAGHPPPGNIAFFSQSGALCTAILDWALAANMGFSRFISLGNKAVINEADMLEFLGDDPATDVILGYIENVENGPDFLKAAARVTRKKPVILIKSGTTSAGARATSSHTGAIAGDDAAYTAAFRKTGIIRARDMVSFFDLAQAFSYQPLPRGAGLCILTNSGGPGAMAADTAESSALSLPQVTAATLAKLQDAMPSCAALYNPIDIIGDANAERYRQALNIITPDPNIDVVLVLLSPTSAAEIEETAQAIADSAKASCKPFFASFMGGAKIQAGARVLRQNHIPCSTFPEPLIASIEALHRQALWLSQPILPPEDLTVTPSVVRQIIDTARANGQTDIVEFQAQDVLRAYGLPAPRAILATSAAEAADAAAEIGGPVVIKIASPQILHKSDIGGVQANLTEPMHVAAAFDAITARAHRAKPQADIHGCLVQAMAPKGCKELIVGFHRDVNFGPLMMFGLGGIYVETLKDIVFRLAPLNRTEASEMIHEIRAFPLLSGTRGEPPVDMTAIEDTLLAISALAMDFPEIAEAEVNPLLVNANGAWVADIRLILSPEE